MGAGHRIEVHASPTRDIGKIMNSLSKTIQPYGKCNFIGGMKTAQLALKKRLNKKQQQRIIIFVGSPVEDEVKDLEKLGKQLKKNSVVVDIINFGVENEKNDNQVKLEAFKNAVNSSADNSHLVNVPAGPGRLLLGYLLNTPIMAGSSSGGYSSVQPSGFSAPVSNSGAVSQEDKQIDEAIRISIAAEQIRKEAEKKKEEEEKKKEEEEEKKKNQENKDDEGDDDEGDDEGDDDDDDEMLQKALAMSKALSGQDAMVEEENEEDDDEGDRAEILCSREFLADIMKDIDEMDPNDVDDIYNKLNEDYDDVDDA